MPIDLPRPLSLRVQPHGEAVLVRATGELDLSAAEAFESQLEEELARDGAIVVLDLSGVTFLDSTGLRTLLRIAEEDARSGSRLSIRRELSPPVQRLLDLTRIEQQLPFAD